MYIMFHYIHVLESFIGDCQSEALIHRSRFYTLWRFASSFVTIFCSFLCLLSVILTNKTIHNRPIRNYSIKSVYCR